jgi:hypothetical protein
VLIPTATTLKIARSRERLRRVFTRPHAYQIYGILAAKHLKSEYEKRALVALKDFLGNEHWGIGMLDVGCWMLVCLLGDAEMGVGVSEQRSLLLEKSGEFLLEDMRLRLARILQQE